MSLTTIKSPPPSSRLVLTAKHMAAIGAEARFISPSWAATHISDPECPADSASIGAMSGGDARFDDTYSIYPVEGGGFQLSNTRDDFAVLGTFVTVEEATAAMRAHAARVRY